MKEFGWKIHCTVLGVWVAMGIVSAARAQTFTNLLNFQGPNGAQPGSISLVQGADGDFYGTTHLGGSGGDCGRFRCGTAFKITSEGTITTRSLTPSTGIVPYAGLILAPSGSFFGTSTQDGAYGGGTIFEITKAGKVVIFYSFCAQPNCTDGNGPQSRLIQAADGNFYGTTTYGGANVTECGGIGCGTVFKITPGGTLTTLYSFCTAEYCSDGQYPTTALIQGGDGSFYGTTFAGGLYEQGTVFRITRGGTFTRVYSFCSQPSCADGLAPVGMMQPTDGNFYGTTFEGGNESDQGTVFRISPLGELTTLYTFCSQDKCSDGSEPTGGLTEGTDGNLYGLTGVGGSSGWGTIFKITAQGVLTTLHSFNNSDGGNPEGELLQSTSGAFYGTTFVGGDSTCDFGAGCGTVFRLDPGLSPFVALVRKVGKVGSTVEILGQGFTGTTGVSFSGTSASFAVNTDTFLTATVPQGASSGYVTVTTPTGTLTSNIPFHIIE